MKKRVLSVLLVIALLVAVGIIAAQADDPAPTPAEIKAAGDAIVTAANAMTFEEGSIPTTCPKCGEVEWQELNQENFTEVARTGHWYLTSDITVEDTSRNPVLISASGTLCLHLNGHSVSVTSASFDGRCLYASTGNTLNLYDNGEGSVNGLGPAPAMWVWGGTANIYGGDLNAENSSAAIEMRPNGTLNFFGGSLSTGKIWYSGGGTSANIYGGSITYASPRTSGYDPLPQTNIHGGTVDQASAWQVTLTVTGGNIADLTSAQPTATGGIFVSGNPQIGTVANPTLCKITYGELTEGASINYGTYTGVISTAYETKPEAEAVAATFPKMPGKEIAVNEDKTLSVVARTEPYTPEEIITESAKQTFSGTEAVSAFCYACNKTVTWNPITEAAAVHQGAMAVGGHYFLANDITQTVANGHAINFNNYTGQKEYCLHLNGKTVTAAPAALTAICVWTSQQTVNIMGNGTVQNQTGLWGALHVQAATTVNVYGGTYGRSASSDQNRAINVAKEGATVNLYGVTVTSADANPERGKLDVNIGTANVYGGTISCARSNGGTLKINNATVNTVLAASGSADLIDGTVTTLKATGGAATVSGGTVTTLNATAGTVGVSGGTVTMLTTSVGANISGGTVTTLSATGGTVALSGKPTVGLSTELDVDVTGLTGGQISGMKEGVFTTAFASKQAAEAVIPYFTVEGTKAVTAVAQGEGFALSYGEKVYTPEEIVTLSAQQTFSGTEPVEDWCYACNKKVTWKPLTKDSDVWNDTDNSGLRGGKHFFIANDITTNNASGIFNFGTWSSAETHCGNWCLHMNGKTLDNAGGPVVRQWNGGGTVTVMGDGVLKSGAMNYGALYANGGDITTGANAHINSYFSGDIYSYGGNSFAVSSGGAAIMNIYGGNIKNKLRPVGSGGTTVYNTNIDSIDNDSNAITFYLTTDNCTIGTLVVPGGGDITVNGGTVNTVQVKETGTIAPKLVGDITVGAINLAEGKVLDLTGMTGGSLNVGAHEGVFTTNFEDPGKAAAAAAFITSPTKIVAVDGLALTTADGKATVINGNNQKAFATYAAAEAAYTEGYIKLLVDENITITKDVTIDFNGQSVDIAGSGKLTGIDSTTLNKFTAIPASVKVEDGAQITFGAPVLENDEEKCTVSGYLPVTDEGLTTFSYFTMKLSGVALKANPNSVGLYYKGTWNFNDNLPAGKVEAGVAVNVKDQNVENPFEDGIAENTANGYYSTDAASVANGQPVTSVLVNDIMKAEGRDAAKNSEYGQMKIKAAAFITVNDQDIVTGIKNLSVCDVLKLIEGSDEAYAANETKLANFYNTWKTLANLDTWGLTKIGQ